jgi:cholesterol 25-hydroxylase
MTVATICLLLFSSQSLQPYIDAAWHCLGNCSAFQSVYFETVYAVIAYGILLLPNSFMERHPDLFLKFKIDPKAQFQHPSWTRLLTDGLAYMAPLGLMDTFMVKWYAGVPEAEILLKREWLIQRTRALPELAPSVGEIMRHLLVSLLIYDLLFFCVHLTLHKHYWLYKHIHAYHHDHPDGLFGRVTSQLTVVEPIVLILSANFSLKVLGAHPLTRFVFVPVFLWLLIENHWNYEFPYSYDKLVPFRLCGGSRHHHSHHSLGSANYQPYFTYLDAAHEAWRRWRTRRHVTTLRKSG